MKKLISLSISLVFMAMILCCCQKPNNIIDADNSSDNSLYSSVANSQTLPNSSPDNSSSKDDNFIIAEEAPVAFEAPKGTIKPQTKANPKIFLAGDSTVKTYAENTFIGGWGQFLQNFLNVENVTVVNKSEGGRSSRSFLNEGRLFEIDGKSKSPIADEISNGDYLFIQFGHNDDMTRNKFDTYIERQVPLGEPNAEGVFPTDVPTQRVSKYHLPKTYYDAFKNSKSDITSAYGTAGTYGTHYFAADQGTFKGYLKIYIDFARSKGAIPVLCTPVARVKFDKDFNLLPGNGRHGPKFEYVTAVRQLAQEEDCLLIDLFDFTKTLLETAAKTAQNSEEANYLMALKPNSLVGQWPVDYDAAYNNKELGCTGIEATHYNKYGAYLTAAKVAEELINFSQTQKKTSYDESITFGNDVLSQPSAKIVPSAKLNPSTVDNFLNLYKVVKP